MTLSSSWTLLPPLRLHGAGTAHVESFESYLGRLAWAVGESPRLLLRLLDEQIEDNHGHGRGGIVAINGPGDVSFRRVQLMEQLTGQALRQSTFWVLADVLQPRGSGLVGSRHDRRWCPECLADEGEFGAPTDRLVWNFVHYERCGIHGTSIRTCCRECGRPQPYLDRLIFRRLCCNCRAPLGHAGEPADENRISEWVGRAIEDLVSWTASDRAHVIPRENYERYMTLMLDAGSLEPIKGRCRTLHKDITQFRRRRATVSTLLNLSALQGVLPLELLLYPEQAATRPLFDRSADFSEIPFPLGSYSLAAREIFRVAETLLGKGTLLPPFAVISRILKMPESDTIKFNRRAYERYSEAYAAQASVRAGCTRRTFTAALRSGLYFLDNHRMSKRDLARRLRESYKLPSQLSKDISGTSKRLHQLINSP